MSRPFARLLPGVTALAMIAGGATAASAAPILIQSGDTGAGQTETCANSMNSSTTCVDITPHSAWQPNNPNFPVGSGATGPSGAVWVSFAPTGAPPDSTFAPQGTTMTYTYTFMAPPNAYFLGRLWSDDQTTAIYLDGMLVGGGSATVGGGATYGGGGGGGGGGGYIITGFLGGGTPVGGGGGPGGSTTPDCGGCTIHTVTAGGITQQGSGHDNATNPFGGLLVGTATVPEPATLALFGMGLLGAGVLRRKQKKA